MIIPEQAVALLPCPFCGEAMELRGDYTHEAAWNYFEHANAIDSKCILKDHTINAPDFRTPDPAEAAEWNKRAAQPLMGVQRPDREAVARVLWDESGQGGVTFETQQRRYEVADAILALLRTRADHCAACGEYMPPHARHMCANWPPASPPPLAESGWQERWLTGALAGLDERLDRLLLKADDNERFVLSKDSARNIVEIAREWLRNRLPAPPHIAEEEQTK